MSSAIILPKSRRRFHVSLGIDRLWCSWMQHGKRKSLELHWDHSNKTQHTVHNADNPDESWHNRSKTASLCVNKVDKACLKCLGNLCHGRYPSYTPFHIWKNTKTENSEHLHSPAGSGSTGPRTWSDLWELDSSKPLPSPALGSRKYSRLDVLYFQLKYSVLLTYPAYLNLSGLGSWQNWR